MKPATLARALRAAGLTVTAVAEPDGWESLDGEVTLAHGVHVQVGHDYAIVNALGAADDASRSVVMFHWPMRRRLLPVVADAIEASKAAQVGTYAALNSAAVNAHQKAKP